jgi:hypothetical protein
MPPSPPLPETTGQFTGDTPKRPYHSPVLADEGSLADLTRSAGGTGVPDGGSGPNYTS